MERNPLIVIGVPTHDEGDADTLFENWQRATQADFGCVIIDADEDSATITEKVMKAGGQVHVNQRPEEYLFPNYKSESGAERVAACVNQFDRLYNHDVIVNVHAKLPELSADLLRALMYPLANMDVEVATLVAPLNKHQANSAEFLKAEIEWNENLRIHVLENSRAGRVINIARNVSDLTPGVEIVRHVPIYAYKRASLDRFVRFEPTIREMEERLEPERALSNGMRVEAVMADDFT